jgi:hypothetical protein
LEHSDVTDTTYDRQLDFEEKCAALTKRIDAGDVPSTIQLARALELPLSYVEAAITIATVEFVKSNVGRRQRV